MEHPFFTLLGTKIVEHVESHQSLVIIYPAINKPGMKDFVYLIWENTLLHDESICT